MNPTISSAVPEYPALNLWPLYTPTGTTLSLWSPAANAVRLNLYEEGDGGGVLETVTLDEIEPGLWQALLTGDQHGTYYTYQIKSNGNWLAETPGIYAQAVGVNGKRAMIIDLDRTNPEEWHQDQRPRLSRRNQAIIYELHVRDMTIHPSSQSSHPGKFLGLVEPGTISPAGLTTGIDHLRALGITHVHLLPSFDHYAIDETRLEAPQYNWGYDPQNYNVPEGSYATDPYRAGDRIREFKEMVQAFHKAGIGVILDVVYNHTGRTEESNFNLEFPGYYYRFNEEGSWSDATACGNETASEKTMMRKFMLESIRYWLQEYHIDGFRFDLMGIHDIETMNQIAEAAHNIWPDVLLYGEGWTAGASPLADSLRALKVHTWQMPQISAFSDELRDGIKGSVFADAERGFVSGATEKEASIQFGVVGAVFHEQIAYQQVNYSDTSWAIDPWQAIVYVSCHDNHTLYDKLKISCPDATPDEIIRMHKLALGIVLTSQGTPFLHAGIEMMRTKQGAHNSYNLPDSINQMDWNRKAEYADVFEYVQKLIALRRQHPDFWQATGSMVREHLRFRQVEPGLIGFEISNLGASDSWSQLLIYYSARKEEVEVSITQVWNVILSGELWHLENPYRSVGQLRIPPQSMLIAYQD